MYLSNRPLPASNSETARLGSGRAVGQTLCKLDQKLLLVAVVVKQRLDVVVALPGREAAFGASDRVASATCCFANTTPQNVAGAP